MASWFSNQTSTEMKTFPLPALAAFAAALTVLPFSLPAASMLFLTGWFGIIIHADYVLRHRRLPLPRHTWHDIPALRSKRPLLVSRERNRLAA
jgi:NADH:ubiquinone oxidoreductase subunit 4 (subunit M)